MKNNNQNKKEIQINASDEVLKGYHANLMQISHDKEEFFLDFYLLHSPIGQMVSRIIVTPGLMKRISAVIEKNIEKYEEKFEEIEEAEEPKATFGFKADK